MNSTPTTSTYSATLISSDGTSEYLTAQSPYTIGLLARFHTERMAGETIEVTFRDPDKAEMGCYIVDCHDLQSKLALDAHIQKHYASGWDENMRAQIKRRLSTIRSNDNA